MSRNENSLFSQLPKVNIGRSKFRRNQSVKFTFNTGTLVPFYVDEVLPGDTHSIKTNKVVRLQTPITPFMDQMYLDVYYFFVPNRLVWNHWKEFNGENSSGPWIPQVSYTVPTLKESLDSFNSVHVNSAADYMGIPIGFKQDLEFNALPFRAYALIWNEWFRDENLQYPINIPLGDITANYIDSANGVTVYDGSSASDFAARGMLCAVAKFHDYFTSALPAPQKGPDVTLGLVGNIPVVGNGQQITFSNSAIATADNSGVINTSGDSVVAGYPLTLRGVEGLGLYAGYQTGLAADLSGISVATINQLRTAFQIQKLYEADARGGSRYTEILRQHFGVVSPDARLQRPEYLGGNRIPINVHQVVQESESGSTPQGNTAAYSLTVDGHGDFSRSFTEHGFIIGLCCVRYDHTYQQGLERFWSRKTRFDYYWPVFAHLGEQAILNKEIYVSGTSADNEVFGYQEAWADYRFKPSRVSGEMRSDAQTSLDFWHLADDYSSKPNLSAGWIVEDKSNVDRVLHVTSSVSNQLLADFYIENTTTRPMPLHSVPGLVDHF